MRLAVAAAVLGLACAPLYAQGPMERLERDPPKDTRKESKRPAEKEKAPRAQERPPRQPSSAPSSKRPSESESKVREQRAREPQQPPAPSTSRVDSQRRPPDSQRRPPDSQRRPPDSQRRPPTTQGGQQLRELDDERREQRQQQNADWRRTMDEKRVVRCTAYPVCKSGGYGGCRGVEQSYSGAAAAASGRQDIVRQCMQANTPDSCNCAPQCGRVAQCS